MIPYRERLPGQAGLTGMLRPTFAIRGLKTLLSALLLVSLAGLADAEPSRAPIDRNLLIQEQQADTFTLRARQATEALRAPRGALQERHTAQRRQQEQLHIEQQRRLESLQALPPGPSTEALRQGERARMQRERATQLDSFSRGRPSRDAWGPQLQRPGERN